MPARWIFQANPDQYDIDRALETVDVINWRVPQYTSQIGPGDDVLIWRAGEDSGIVGVGKVLEPPGRRKPTRTETQFHRDAGEDVDPGQYMTTRVPLKVSSVPLVPKQTLLDMPELRDHQIVTAPMGTVFPLKEPEWESLTATQPSLKRLEDFEVQYESEGFPAVFSWDDRKKSVYPLPGGYESYLDTLARILTHVEQVRPDRSDLDQWLQDTFDVSGNSARFGLNFLERVSLLTVQANHVDLSDNGRFWLSSRDPAFLIGLLHSRIRLIGELLYLLVDEPSTPEELLQRANENYAMGWKSRAQIDRRRGWLESAGAIGVDEANQISLTEFGARLLPRLNIVEPHEIETPSEPEPEQPAETRVEKEAEKAAEPTERLRRAEELYAGLRESSHRSDAPDDLEKITAQAFGFLGFESSWMGGSGKTDVLLVAELGPEEGFRVIIDCKTTAQGGVGDQQVDWVTLEEHKATHQADYVALVGPEFAGPRVRARAGSKGVTLIDVETLGSLLRQHAQVPMGLRTYRFLFESSDGAEGSARIGEDAEESDRQLRLLAEVVRLISRFQGREGPLDARDLYWLLRDVEEELGEYTEEEIEEILKALSAPGISVLHSAGVGYMTLGARSTIVARLELIADLIGVTGGG